MSKGSGIVSCNRLCRIVEAFFREFMLVLRGIWSCFCPICLRLSGYLLIIFLYVRWTSFCRSSVLDLPLIPVVMVVVIVVVIVIVMVIEVAVAIEGAAAIAVVNATMAFLRQVKVEEEHAPQAHPHDLQ